MRLKQIVVMLAIVALAMPLAAQMGMQVPTLSGIFRPVVGTGAVYQVTQEGGKTSTMDFAVLGKEDMGGKTGYWIEMSMTDPKAGGEITMKVLETVDGNAVTYTKMVFQMPGMGPMEMDGNMMNMGGRRTTQQPDADFRNKAELVGTESVTVPAGTFSCEHYRMKDKTGDAWISDKVSPWSVVKATDQTRSMVLTKVVTDAKDRITGTPTKFDPMQMMRNRQGQ
jgi:hypothetical protein